MGQFGCMLTYVPGDADTQVAQNQLENKLTLSQSAESKKLTEHWQAQRVPAPKPAPELEVPKPE